MSFRSILFCLFGLVVLLQSATPLSAEDKPVYIWTFALGGFSPVDSSQGVVTPVIYAQYKDDKDQSLAWSLSTVTLRLAYRPGQGPIALLWRGRTFAEGDTDALYDAGHRRGELASEIHGSRQGIGYFLLKRAKLELMALADYRFLTFRPYPGKTKQDFDFLDSYDETRLGLKGFWQWGNLDFKAEAFALSRKSEAWELESQPAEKGSRFLAQAGYKHLWSKKQKTELGLEAGGGQGLDFFSSFDLGGLGGDYAIPGYYRNEFRSSSFYKFELRHQWGFGKGARLFASLVKVAYQPIELTFRDEPEPIEPVGVAIGVFYPVQSLKGMPLILTYGEGLVIPEDSPEAHRKQMGLVAVAAF